MWHGCLVEGRPVWVIEREREGGWEAEKGHKGSKWHSKHKSKGEKVAWQADRSVFKWVFTVTFLPLAVFLPYFISSQSPLIILPSWPLSSTPLISFCLISPHLAVLSSTLLLKVSRRHWCCLFIVAILQWTAYMTWQQLEHSHRCARDSDAH